MTISEEKTKKRALKNPPEGKEGVKLVPVLSDGRTAGAYSVRTVSGGESFRWIYPVASLALKRRNVVKNTL